MSATTTTTNTSKPAWGPIAAFVLIAWGLAWIVCLPLWLGDGLSTPYGMLLLPVMMWTPAVATLVVTLFMRMPPKGERLRFLGIWPMRPAKRLIGLIVLGWLAPIALVVLIIAVSGALGLATLDFTFAGFAQMIAAGTPEGVPAPPIELLVLVQLVMIPVGAIINCFAAFGEEIGWRGWLLPALRPLGTWPALLVSGAIWGIWHTPIILLGYNFGRTDITGVLLMLGGCVAWGVFFGWLRLRSGSLWPAVIGHGSLNAVGGLVLLLQPVGQTFDLATVGPIGVVGWGVLAVLVAVLVATGQFRRQPPLASTPAPRTGP